MAGIMAATVLVQNSHSKSDTSYIFLKTLFRDWSKSIGGEGGWTGAFGNVVDKKHMTHPLPSAQK